MARSRIEIVQDILKTIKENESCTRTKMIRFANLDWEMAERYVNTLQEEGFVDTRVEKSSRGKESYHLTEKGEDLSNAAGKMRELSTIF